MNKYQLKKQRVLPERMALVLLIMALITFSVSGTAWAQKMKNYARSLAKQCYPNERIVDSMESVRLGNDKVTAGAKVFLTNGIEMHFIMHYEKVSKSLSEIVIDDAQCFENRVKAPCSCPAITMGTISHPGENSSSDSVGMEQEESTAKPLKIST